MVTMFMPLLNEGIDVSRPVEVTPLEGAVYRVEGPMPADEEWEFPPGTTVECKWKKFDDGEHRLIPDGPAPTVRSAFADYFKRGAGLSLVAIPLALALPALPRAADGSAMPIPLLLVGVVLSLISIGTLRWLRPRSLIGKRAVQTALGSGILACLASALVGR